MADLEELLELASGYVEEFNDYCREMTTGELAPVPATELERIIARAITAAVAAEREACAEVAKGIRAQVFAAHQHERAYVAECIETAIRARSTP